VKWQKQGLLYRPDAKSAFTHAANPFAEHLRGDAFRVYFSSRDKENRSHICFLDLKLGSCPKVLRIGSRPVLFPGEPGTFDDSGVSMSCVVRSGKRRFLYYLGWNLGVTVPWRNSIGLAVSDSESGGFKRYSRAPILDQSDEDPFSLSYPWVLREGSLWRMWYGSNLRWGGRQEDMAHVIKYAKSRDGIRWKRDGKIAVPFKSNKEYALSRPCVLHENGWYRMWYSYRGRAYRIGYAESKNGKLWKRKDEEAGITVSRAGWDSESVEYACVFAHRGRKYMLYNGNRYGKTGFGLAVLELDK
jgi:hypothetical protein